MKREEKNALSRQRIIEAAMQEFSARGYNGASLNTVCAEHTISKGIIYHYFKDKDELYLVCVGECFNILTAYMKRKMDGFGGTLEQKLQAYFDARLHFFVENPVYMGIFADAAYSPPPGLFTEVTACRREFDELNISVLTEFLNSKSVRNGLSVPTIVEDFRSYMDFFNMRFKDAFQEKIPSEIVLHEHEERCHRQLNILLYGVLGEKMSNNAGKESLLSTVAPSKAIVKLAIPATLALLAKAVYNIVDTAYIGMLDSDIALAAVGVTLPLLLIMVSIENIFAAGASVLAGRQLGAGKKDEANQTVTTIVGFSIFVGIALCVLGIIFMEPLLRAFGASDAVLPQAKDYAFWMFIAALFNLPAQSLNCAARAESSVKISSIAVITGAALNVILDPVFMFSWGFNMGVEGASLATTISQCVTFIILMWFYLSGRSIIKVKPSYFKLTGNFLWSVISIGIPTAVIQICLAVATSLTNIAAKPLPDSDLIIAAYGIVQRLILIGCYVVMGFMQGYQPVASYAFGAKNEERFHESVRFALKGSLLLTVVVAIIYIALSSPLILLFNRNPLVVEFGKWLLISQVALYPAFGLCYMMTITFQTIGSAKMGVFLSLIRQGLFYVPFILTLPGFMGVTGIYLSQPAADVLTVLICIFLIKPMKKMASKNMG